MLRRVFHHLLIGDHKAVLVVLPDRVTDHRLPDHGAQPALPGTGVRDRRDHLLHMADPDHDTPGVLDKGHLLGVGDTEGGILHDVPIEIVKDRLLVFLVLYPYGTEFQLRLPFLLEVDLIGILHSRKPVPHQPSEGTGREAVRRIGELCREKMTMGRWIALFIGMLHCPYDLPGGHEARALADTGQR